MRDCCRSAPALPCAASNSRALAGSKPSVSSWLGPTIACTAVRLSTLSFSVDKNSRPTPAIETMIPEVPRMNRNLPPLAVHQRHAHHGHEKVDRGENDIAPVRLHVGESALQQNAGVEADDRVDAGGRVAGENHAGQQERDHIFAAQQRIAHLFAGRGAALRGSGAVSSISLISRAACSSVRERSSAA